MTKLINVENLKTFKEEIVTNVVGDLASLTTNAHILVDAINEVSAQTSAGFDPNTDEIKLGTNAGDTTQSTHAVAVGSHAGETNQGSVSVAIGPYAASTTQGRESVAIGYSAGNNTQGAHTIAIGSNAGSTSQADYSIAVGNSAAITNQGKESLAIGYRAGKVNQGAGSVAIGSHAAESSQADYSLEISSYDNRTTPSQGFEITYDDHTSVYNLTNATDTATLHVNGKEVTGGSSYDTATEIAIGKDAGKTNQGQGTIAIGSAAGETNQGRIAIGIGNGAGYQDQGESALAIGYGAGQIKQGKGAIAIGQESGNQDQAEYSMEIASYDDRANPTKGFEINYDDATKTYDFKNATNDAVLSVNGKDVTAPSAPSTGFDYTGTEVAIGESAARNSQQHYAIAIGYKTAYEHQGHYSVAIGNEAGYNKQGDNSVAIGNKAGTNQNTRCVAIGYQAGESQADDAVAIGSTTGQTNQGNSAIAIGFEAGKTSQSGNGIAIGRGTGETNQGSNAVAIGGSAGQTNQGTNAIAIGFTAAQTDQPDYGLEISNYPQTNTNLNGFKITYTDATKTFNLSNAANNAILHLNGVDIGGSANDMETFSGLDSIQFNDSFIDPTQSEGNAIKLIGVSAAAVAKSHLWEILIDVSIAKTPNLEKVFGSEGLLFISPVEGNYHKIEFYNHTKNKLGLGLLDTANDNYIPVEYLAAESDITGQQHYEGLASIDIPSDILFTGKTAQEVMTTLITATTAKHGSNRWSFALTVDATNTVLQGIFRTGYIAITYVGQGHHEAKFYSDDEKMYISTYNASNQVRIDYQQIQFVNEFTYTIIEEAIQGNEPSRQECVLAFMKLDNFDWEKRMEFRIKSLTKDKYFAIEYLGNTGDSQSVPGNFRIFTSTVV